ncbi:SapC family protein [Sphingomonas oryzagri]|uniref:SapC family protein n=1 Tax=Sphingomonas oryzagri TaxID=3042314 RepID=A0ABT6N1Q3_9SPHN|nr:SapC family protein [Sphingomonas oryzagri]MDH7638733.1 SapC family protein [Sphingomonas oryzagri]
MASAPEQGLPLFYNDLIPISNQEHADWKLRAIEGASFLKNAHAVPLLVEEFIQASRFYPIVFSLGENPVPLALMGLNEGVNAVVDERGMFPDDWYVPAYVRRYPFLLARLRPDSDDLSLCVDPTSDVFGQYDEGEPVFEDGAPSERTKAILQFCEQIEQAGTLNNAFFADVKEQKLLTDGEFTAQPTGAPQPYVYRGFQIISEDAVKNLRGDVARKWLQNGLMPLVYAHLFSLQRMADIFGRQAQRGQLPPPNGTMLG